MSCYAPLARWYDRLTGDVPYGAFADFDEALFRADGGAFHLLLDLCCGTGTLTWLMAAVLRHRDADLAYGRARL